MDRRVYPYAKSIFYPDALGVGPLTATGATVHYSADRDMDRFMRSCIRAKTGYHLVIDRAGAVHQTAYFDKRVNHAGRALWLGKSPNRAHFAVCLVSWGFLKRDDDGSFKSWNGEDVPLDDAVFSNNTWWDSFTDAQENALVNVLCYLVGIFGINHKEVCGHDECCIPPGRKSDPGGCLSSFSMNELRDRIKLAPKEVT